ncbi:MAG: beta-N-acetylglucosaminidase domain-containing protein [Verrucomicrobia bacterium]|nr:beta-N-acetylglucosaminidase domain-containing protein [Verrucomicrobiota bacterium]
MSANPFICGVIEGFYGRPWTGLQRRRLFGWLQQWGMNTYMYAPKDDIKHRALWREPYDDAEAAELKGLIADCQARNIDFVYAIAPGLDIEYGVDASALLNKLRQVAGLGARSFAILFDDISHRMRAADAGRFATFAEAQSKITNAVFHLLRDEIESARLWFCPTPYCGRMAGHAVKKCDYLREIGERLDRDIDIFWTGPEIVSETISRASMRELQTVLKRKPLLWDNLHANDYDLRRIYLGPYAGRPPQLRAEVRGILSNPNCEFAANFVPLRTLGLYARAGKDWQPRKAFRQALTEWLPEFASRAKDSVTLRDLKLLGDLFYLPYESGKRATQLLNDFEFLLRTPPNRWGKTLTRFDQTCQEIVALFAKVTELDDRELCYSLYRHLWEIKEEAVLLRAYLHWLKSKPKRGEKFSSGEHRPKVYRGGLVAALQRLLPMDESGYFSHALGKRTRNR